MKVSRYNYRMQFGDEVDCLMTDLRRMIESGNYILTGEVEEFERSFAGYVGTRYARGVNTGTDAIIIALLALGIGRGDEVITQANTFHATVAAIRLVGATPVLVDADESSFLMNTNHVETAITERTRAVIPVHLYGKPTPMDGILSLARKHGIAVIEDAAQAHGAMIGGKRVGSFGVISCFSFHPSKNLAAAGDAGAVVTDDAGIDARLKRFRELGQDGQNCHVNVGLNSKIDAIQARILSLKLPYLDSWNKSRRNVAGWYRDSLEGLPVTFQAVSADEQHVFHLFQLRCERRDDLLTHLLKNGVDATIRYPQPIHLQRAFGDMGWKRGEFPVSEQLANELLCLPIRPDLSMTDVEFVSGAIRSFFSE